MDEARSSTSPDLQQEVERLRLERDYLLERASKAGQVRFGSGRDTGVSSNALVRYAVSGEEVRKESYPADPGNLRACYNARDKAPAHLQRKMDTLLPLYREAVGARYPEVLESDDFRKEPERQGIPIDEFISRLDEFAADEPGAKKSTRKGARKGPSKEPRKQAERKSPKR